MIAIVADPFQVLWTTQVVIRVAVTLAVLPILDQVQIGKKNKFDKILITKEG